MSQFVFAESIIVESTISDNNCDDLRSRLPVDGLIGMAYSTLASSDTQSLPFALADAGVIPKNLFAFRLSSLRGISALDMGYINSKRYSGTPWYYPIAVDPDYGRFTYFQLANSVHNVNGHPVEGTRGHYLIDSGSTLIMGPSKQAAAFWAAVPGAAPYVFNRRFYTFPCANPPMVSLSFSGSTVVHAIDPKDFNLGDSLVFADR